MKIDCADYDSMGNHGRFPKQKITKETRIVKVLQFIKNKLKLKSKK